jgi:hypothetical protein
MNPVRWSTHALANLAEREIDRAEAERALAAPDRVTLGHGGRQLLLRRYDDPLLRQPMLLCVVVEDTPGGPVVVTVYKTSKLDKYLQRGTP